MDSGLGSTMLSSSRSNSRKNSFNSSRGNDETVDSIKGQRSRRRSSSCAAARISQGHGPLATNNGFGRDENQLSINGTYKIPILGYEVMEERAKFTVFKLRVENEELNENWLVCRRYTDFERLFAKLKEEFPHLAINLPPKRWLRDNFDTAFLEDRMKGLQAFVDSILVRHKLTQSPTVREFFCFDDPPLSGENNEEANALHFSMDETKLANTLSSKQNEIEVLKTELLLVKTQYENLSRLTKSCSHCNIEQRRSSLTLTSPVPSIKKTNSHVPVPEASMKSEEVFNSISKSSNTSNPHNSTLSPTSPTSSDSSSTSTSYSEIVPSKRSEVSVKSIRTKISFSGSMAESQPPPRKPRKITSLTSPNSQETLDSTEISNHSSHAEITDLEETLKPKSEPCNIADTPLN